jgi:hypothetical protein
MTEAERRVREAAKRLSATGRGRGAWIARRSPAVLAAAAARMLATPDRDLAEAARAAAMSPECAREALANFCPQVTEDALLGLREAVEGRLAPERIQPPALVFHVLAGNLFLSGIESMLTASIAGACSLVRCSAADVRFPRLWVEALRAEDAQFADTVWVDHWPHDDAAATRAVAEAADAVVAFGTDDSVAAVRELTPTSARFIAHGSRVSFSIVPREALGGDLAQIARGIAYDFSVYDQQGCLSPRALFVEADMTAATSLARTVVSAMHELAAVMPRHPLALEEAAALARSRDEALIASALGDAAAVIPAAMDSFLVTVRPAAPVQPGCLNRHCDIRVFTNPDELRAALLPHRGRIACMGIAGEPGRWLGMCGALGVARVCAVGQMQKPPVGWTHDGRPALLDLVEPGAAQVRGAASTGESAASSRRW